MSSARYDGLADWYDATLGNTDLGHFNRDVAVRLTGDGPGAVIDVGCGGGVTAVALAERGWTVTGVDISEDQLRVARGRGIRPFVGDRAEGPTEVGETHGVAAGP